MRRYDMHGAELGRTEAGTYALVVPVRLGVE